jgi:DNA polymerase-3 subunit alpha
MIPDDPSITLADCDDDFEMNLNKGMFPDKEAAKTIWEKAKLLEGKVSGTGVHAGGVIISDNDNVNDYIPLAWNSEKEVWVAQCDMIQAEGSGLLKMDLLGLKTLDVITDTLNMIKKYENISIDIDNIPFEEEVFQNIYAQGNTNSVFQFESDGMKNMLKEFKPTCFEDIILLVACYRPGPMQYLESIINIKNGRANLTYKTPELESILSTTYGATVYQEQVMQIFQKLAGYSLGGADLVRRAMSKKKVEKLQIERDAFVNGDAERGIDGCVNRGISEAVANTLFDEMMDFAKYAFNKSHAAAYALVSYQTAWLKYHYPKYFLCSMFNNKEQDGFQPIISDCKLYNIKLLPPDINYSFYNFVNEDNDIRYGFKGIKGIGLSSQEYVDRIISNRQTGVYDSIQDFLLKNLSITKCEDDRSEYQIFPKEFVEVMINSGCLDSYGYCREDIKIPDEAYEKYLAIDDFKIRNLINSIVFDKNPINKSANISKDVEYLGTIIGDNPLNSYLEDSKYQCVPLNEITPETTVANIMGFVTGIKRTQSKAGNELMIISLQTKVKECTVLCTGSLCEKYTDDFLLYRVVKITVSIKGETFFVKEIHLLKAKIDDYYALIDTKEKTLLLRSILEKEADNRNICIKLSLLWMGKTDLYRVQKPVIVERFFTDSEARLMQSKGIDIRKCN